jgi:hypothetical protein
VEIIDGNNPAGSALGTCVANDSIHLSFDEATKMIRTRKTLTFLCCAGLSMSACTTTYTESDLAEAPLDEPIGEEPNCSLMADEAGCGVESPFDPRDEEL